MDPLAVARRYFDAWNAHDPAGIAATFAPGGTYRDPNVPDGLGPEATGEYAAGLAAGFPDLRFELVSESVTADGRVAAQWVMRGTNTEPFRGLPPTGREVELPGADFIEVEEAGVRRVDGYFDGGTMMRQLGLDVIVQPSTAGPFVFGTSVSVQGPDVQPGAVSVTVVEVRDEGERDRVRAFSREVAKEMLAMPGFVGWVGATVGSRMYTFTAWETPEAPGRLLEEGTHREAVQAFFRDGLGRGGQTGVWAPHHLNALWVRCPACDEMAKASEGGRCRCGAELPPAPRWF